MEEIEYLKSNKGGTKIIYKGYMFTVHKNKKCGGIRWRCAQRSSNCKGSISTNSSGYPYINTPHNHLPDYQSIAIARTKFEDNSNAYLISNLMTLATTVLPNVWEPLTPMKDSMPLEQRLKSPPVQEPILQSQPLSPTKLKVTRQSTKPPQPAPKPVTPEPPNEEVCLRWNSHHSNMQNSFPNLLLKEQYVDATLVAEGQTLKCHRLILSSCSPYFEEILSGISPFQHPVLFMKDIPFWVLKSLCDFMYAGEVHIFQNKLEELLAVAETLKIKGLAGKMDGSSEETKSPEAPKPLKVERKEEKEGKEKKRSSQHVESTPKASAKPVRSTHPSKKTEKISKEGLSKEGILDPLDLLQPVYEEVTKDSAPPKLKEVKNVQMGKKGKLKKRKFSEEREASPPPLFLSRKGTRSRPNVKIPKYYHTHYEPLESTIVREPHTGQPDPLMQVDEIKSEPLDVEDDVIEIEDNVISYNEIPEMLQQDEEIIGNYDSPLVNINAATAKAGKEGDDVSFKKISLVAQPIIMNIRSLVDKSPKALLKIVNVTEIKDKAEDPLASTSGIGKTDSLFDFVGEKSITITNVQSVADIEEKGEENGAKAKQTSSEIQGREQPDSYIEEQTECGENPDIAMVNIGKENITITNVQSIAEIAGRNEENRANPEVTIGNSVSDEDITITNVQNVADIPDVTIGNSVNEEDITIPNVQSVAEIVGRNEESDSHPDVAIGNSVSEEDITITNVQSVTEISGRSEESDANPDIAIGNSVSEEDITITNVQSVAEIAGRNEENRDVITEMISEMEEKGQPVDFIEEQEDIDANFEVRVENIEGDKGVMQSGAENEGRSEENGEAAKETPMEIEEEESAACIEEPVEMDANPNVEQAEEIVSGKNITETEIPETFERMEVEETAPETSLDKPNIDEGTSSLMLEEEKSEAEAEKHCNAYDEEGKVVNSEIDEGNITNSSDSTQVEENPVELGFHIAKVASEQFSTIGEEEKGVVISENHDESGRQITNVVSERIDEQDRKGCEETSDSDPGTLSNHVADGGSLENEKKDEALCEDTKSLAESLEKLLDE